MPHTCGSAGLSAKRYRRTPERAALQRWGGGCQPPAHSSRHRLEPRRRVLGVCSVLRKGRRGEEKDTKLNAGEESTALVCADVKKTLKMGHFLLGGKEIPDSHWMVSEWETALRTRSWGLDAGGGGHSPQGPSCQDRDFRIWPQSGGDPPRVMGLGRYRCVLPWSYVSSRARPSAHPRVRCTHTPTAPPLYRHLWRNMVCDDVKSRSKVLRG